MPTPRPISDASWVAKSGVSTTWLSSVMTPSVAAERQQRRDQRQPGGHERAEGDQQDDRGGDDPEELRRPLAVVKRTTSAPGPPCSTCSCVAAGRERRVLDLLERRGLDVVRALLVDRGGDADAAVLRQLAARPRTGSATLATTVCAAATFLSAASIRALLAASLSVPRARLEDELVGVALGRREVLGQQVVGALALGSRQPEARDLLDADARRDDLDHDQRQQPDAERPPPMAVADAGETDETRAGARGSRPHGG